MSKVIEKLSPLETMNLRLEVMKEARAAYRSALAALRMENPNFDHDFDNDEAFYVYRAIMREISSDTHDGEKG